MLRASKKITINTDYLHSNNGFMLSPVIDINGLILRSDQPLPVPIKEFFIAKNIKLNRIRINYK
jgi:hypothetical protein